MRNRTVRRRITGVSIGLLGLALAAGALSSPATASTATVRYVANTGTDAGPCTSAKHPCKTITYAVGKANPGDTIRIARGHYPENVAVSSPLTFVGAGDGATVITGAAGSSSGAFQIQGTAAAPIAVSLNDLAVSGATNEVGVAAEYAKLALVDVATEYDAVGVRALISTLSAVGSSFSNSVLPAGSTTGTAGIGLLLGNTSAELVRSAVDDNDYLGLEGFAPNSSGTTDFTVTVTSSSVSGNEAPGLAVGQGFTATASQSTFANDAGAAVYVQQSAATLTADTITGTQNFADASSDGVTQGALVALGGTISVTGSIDADNSVPACTTTSGSSSGSAGSIIDGGYNLASDKANACGFAGSRHDLVDTEPHVGSLGVHGGTTQTEVPANTSPAVDRIPLGSAGCLRGVLDQRGVIRPQGPRCDIGSVEVVQKPYAVTPRQLPRATVHKAYRVRLHATGGLGGPYRFSILPHSGHLPHGVQLRSGTLSGKPLSAGRYHFTVAVDGHASRRYTLTVRAG